MLQAFFFRISERVKNLFIHKWKVKSIGSNEYIVVKGTVINPLNPEKKEKVEFLVDTGASGCAIPTDLARKLELQQMGYVDAALADGSVKRVKATYIAVEINKKKILTWTVYDKNFTPILGLDVMRVMGFHIDTPEKKVLVPLKKLRIKKLRLSTGIPYGNVHNFNVNVGGGR